MKFADGEIVYVRFRRELALATIVESKTISTLEHLYVVKLASSEELHELDELSVFKHPQHTILEEKRKEITDMVKTIKSSQATYNNDRKSFQTELEKGSITIVEYNDRLQKANKEFIRIIERNDRLHDVIMERVNQICESINIQIPKELKKYEELTDCIRKAMSSPNDETTSDRYSSPTQPIRQMGESVRNPLPQ